MEPETRKLFRSVGTRLRMSSVARWFHTLFLCVSGTYLILLLSSRLLALMPDWFAPLQVVSVSAATLALAIAFHHRPRAAQVARLIDARTGADDLFLTACLIETAAGQYQPLVVKRAQQRAGGIRPREVAPVAWAGKALHVVLVCGALLAGILHLPQLDPFGKAKERERGGELRNQLAQSRRATTLRKAALKEEASEGGKRVAQVLEDLKKTFRAAKPSDRQGSLKRLGEHQQLLGQLWRQAAEQKLKNATATPQPQSIGVRRGERASAWREELQRGEVASLKKEIAELRQAASQLASTPEGPLKKELTEEIRRRVQEIADFAANEMGCDPLASAQQGALEQLAMAQMEGLSQDALQALQESLELSALELDALAQSLADLKALEDALRAAQLARRLAELELLDGEACSQCKAITDYADLYARLMAGRCVACGGVLGPDGICVACGGGVGPGMGGPGTGTGGKAPEEPAARTDFRPAMSSSALTAGKILLSIRQRGLSDPGEAMQDYRQHIEEIKQGMSEAILHEQVPPAYHETIRKYFDTLDQASEEPKAE